MILRPYMESGPIAAFFLGISSGFPFALIGATLTTRLAQDGISKSSVTAFALTFLAYNFKPLWAPMVDSVSLPLIAKYGQRRSWLWFVSFLLICAIAALGLADPRQTLTAVAISAVAVGVWAYFGVIERLNKLETQSVLLEKDMSAEDERLHNEVTKNTDFRIRYPRGELGQSSQDIEQFMLIEDLYKSVDRMQKHLDDMANNKVNIEFLKEQMEKAQESIEKLKDADREIVYKNGN